MPQLFALRSNRSLAACNSCPIPSPRPTAAANGTGQLPIGSYPEQRLEASDLELVGVVDLLLVHVDGAVISDYKTGIADAGHWDQARIYAGLWLNDTRRNPKRLPVLELRIERPSERTAVVPTEAEIVKAADEVIARVVAAKAADRRTVA